MKEFNKECERINEKIFGFTVGVILRFNAIKKENNYNECYHQILDFSSKAGRCMAKVLESDSLTIKQSAICNASGLINNCIHNLKVLHNLNNNYLKISSLLEESEEISKSIEKLMYSTKYFSINSKEMLESC